MAPSGDNNNVVVFRADITNLHSETLEGAWTSTLEVFAIDSVGNTYDEEQRICDDIGPGETLPCEFVFDVPTDADLVDLRVHAIDIQRFSFGGE